MEPIKVLDKGYIKLIDSVGDDSRVVFAARRSVQDEKKKHRPDEHLIDYLIRNSHLSPLEHCSLTVEVKMPIFIARQCVSGDSELHFVNGYNEEYKRKVSVKSIYDTWNNGRGRNRQQIRRRKLLAYDTSTGEQIITHIKDIWSNGVKPVYDLKFVSVGQEDLALACTIDHPIYTEHGWMTLQDILKSPDPYTVKIKTITSTAVRKNTDALVFIPEHTDNEVWATAINELYEVSTHGRVRRKADQRPKTVFATKGDYPRLCVTLKENIPGYRMKKYVVARLVAEAFCEKKPGCKCVLHCDGNAQNNHFTNLRWGTPKENTVDAMELGTMSVRERRCLWTTIASYKYRGEEEVYDLEVDTPEHNFVCGGIVVHNCMRHRTFKFSELSLRYSSPDHLDFYVPTDARILEAGGCPVAGDEYSWQDEYTFEQEEALSAYLNRTDLGVASELARINVPVSMYTNVLITMDLRNCLHFLKERLSPSAQYEIRVYAEALLRIVKELFPQVVAAWEEHHLKALTLSKEEGRLILSLVDLEAFDAVEGDPRKLRILWDKLQKFLDSTLDKV